VVLNRMVLNCFVLKCIDADYPQCLVGGLNYANKRNKLFCIVAMAKPLVK